jgi:hypothetical protein
MLSLCRRSRSPTTRPSKRKRTALPMPTCAISTTEKIVPLPRQFQGTTLSKVADGVVSCSAGGLPPEIALNFAGLGFVRPAAVVFLSNLMWWLHHRGTPRSISAGLKTIRRRWNFWTTLCSLSSDLAQRPRRRPRRRLSFDLPLCLPKPHCAPTKPKQHGRPTPMPTAWSDGIGRSIFRSHWRPPARTRDR